MSNQPQIGIVPIGNVTPYDKSARIHNRHQRRKLRTLLKRFGQVLPIVIDDNGVIVDGHAVWEELKGLGHTEIQVVVAANRTLAEIRTLRLALNRIAEDAVWDNEKLRAEFAELIELGIDVDLTGFDTVEVDMTLSIAEPRLLSAITLRRPSRASVWLRAAAPAPASARTGGRPIGSP